MSEELDFGPDILTLEDDEGNEHKFEVIDSIEHNDQEYLALIPVFEDAADSLEDDGELVILKTEEDSDGEYLAAIEDEEEFNEVAAIFMERLEDLYEIKS